MDPDTLTSKAFEDGELSVSDIIDTFDTDNNGIKSCVKVTAMWALSVISTVTILRFCII
jgi:hypothetical protein